MISRLYLKILFAFIAVQILAVLAVGGLVHSGKIRPPFTRYAEERMSAVKEMLTLQVNDADYEIPDRHHRIDTMLTIFADAVRGQAWITDEKGTVIHRSFKGKFPLRGNEKLEHSQQTPDGDTLYLLEREGHDKEERKAIYVVGTIPFQDTELTVHLLHSWRKRKEEVWLMKGLLLMGSLSALLLIPVSRRITRPIKELTQSAEHIAQGDFSPRVKTVHKDEVGKLTTAFNHMVESLEKTIRGGRELTANLSHELRSPLARMRMSQQILLERLESGRTDGMEKHLNKLDAEINHMDGLIDKIIKLSKLDLQEPQPREDAILVSALLQDTLDRHDTLMSRRSIAVDMQVPQDATLLCRADDLRIAMDNVVANSVKYSPDHTTISIRTTSDEESVAIRVANPYQALSSEELESIFSPFTRLGYDTVEGNGLGLAFARKIVEDHGGTMEASSENEQFVMTIRLPLE